MKAIQSFTSFLVSFALGNGVLSAASANFDFTGETTQANSGSVKTSVATSNDFGSGVTISDLTLTPGSGGTCSITDTHGLTGNMHGYLSFREPNPTVSFTITVDGNHVLDLNGLAFTYGVYTNAATQFTDASYSLASTLGGIASGGTGTVTLNQTNTFQGGAFAATFDAALTGLTNTSVTFTWTLDTVDNRSSANADRGHILDNIVLTGSVSTAADTDGDGLPDIYEQTIIDFDGGDAVDGLEDVMGTGASPAVTDFDNDGSNDAGEWTNGTSPTNPDSDEDGFYDGAETDTGIFVSYDYGTNTGNTGTDPLDDDSDDDTLLDGVESGTGVFVDETNTGSDPNLANTDASVDDTMTDAEEVANGLDPNSDAPPNGDLDDPDDDLLFNIEEVLTYQTDPLDDDTDNDDLKDGIEVLDWGTDPLVADSDGDGLNDGAEDANGDGVLDATETDPSDRDSDNDGFSDGLEVAESSDPRSDATIPAQSAVVWGTPASTVDSSAVDVSGTVLEAVNFTRGTEPALQEVTIGATTVAFVSDFDPTDNGAGWLTNDTPVNSQIWDNETTGAFREVMRSLHRNTDAGDTTAVIDGLTPGTTYQIQIFYANEGQTNFPLSPMDLTAGNTVQLDPGYLDGPDGGQNVTGTFTAASTAQAITLSDSTGGGVEGINAYVLSLPAEEAPLVVSTAFNGDDFEVTAIQLNPAKSYILTRSLDLADGFPVTVDGPFTGSATHVFVDVDAALEQDRAFYRVEEVSP